MTEREAKLEAKKEIQELLTNMDATIYRLNLLCNRFEKDKDVVLKESIDMKAVVKTLQEEISAFAKMRGEIGKTLSEKIDQATSNISREADESIRLALNSNMAETVRRLDMAVRQAEDKFQYFYDLDKKRIIYTILGLIVLPIVTGVLIAKLLMPVPPAPVIMRVSDKTCEIYKRACRNF